MDSIDILGYSSFYCPSEMSKTGKSLISTKSDVFSLGMFIFYLLSKLYRVIYELIT